MIAVRTFPLEPSSPRQARRFLTESLDHLDPELVAVLELMLSEAATNSIQHAQSEFEVRIVVHPDEVSVEVTDHGGGTPVLRQPTPDESTGRGLMIVSSLADHFEIDTLASGNAVRFSKRFAHATPQAHLGPQQ